MRVNDPQQQTSGGAEALGQGHQGQHMEGYDPKQKKLGKSVPFYPFLHMGNTTNDQEIPDMEIGMPKNKSDPAEVSLDRVV